MSFEAMVWLGQVAVILICLWPVLWFAKKINANKIIAGIFTVMIPPVSFLVYGCRYLWSRR